MGQIKTFSFPSVNHFHFFDMYHFRFCLLTIGIVSSHKLEYQIFVDFLTCVEKKKTYKQTGYKFSYFLDIVEIDMTVSTAMIVNHYLPNKKPS